MLVAMAATAPSRPGALPPVTENPTAAPTALMAVVVVVVVVGVIMTATPTILTAAHGGG